MYLYGGPFVYYVPLQGLVVHHVLLLGSFVYYVPLQRLVVHPYASTGAFCLLYASTRVFCLLYASIGFLVYCVPLQGRFVVFVLLQER